MLLTFIEVKCAYTGVCTSMQVQSTFFLHQLQSKVHHSSLALTELLFTCLDFWKS